MKLMLNSTQFEVEVEVGVELDDDTCTWMVYYQTEQWVEVGGGSDNSVTPTLNLTGSTFLATETQRW